MLITFLLHVALAIDPTPAVPLRMVQAAVAEAAAIWAPYGVDIEAAWPLDCALCGPGRWADDDLTVLTVVAIGTGRSAVAAGWRGPLGTITFVRNHVPTPVITVFLADIEQFIACAHVLGLQQPQWPRSIREEIFGRVLGRVLAHEIGHYVLQSPRHAATGLMKSLQRADDLVAPSRRGFRLSRADAAQLRDRR
jgi:hypothetical protein